MKFLKRNANVILPCSFEALIGVLLAGAFCVLKPAGKRSINLDLL